MGLGGTLLSSGDAYAGFAASFHAVEAGAVEIADNPSYRVAVHVGRPHRLWDRREGAACVGPHARGDVVITTLGETRSVKWDRSSSLLALSLDPRLVRALVLQSDVNPDRLEILGRFSHRDPELENAAFALLRELMAGMPSGPVYGEEIAAAIVVRLASEHSSFVTRGGLSKASLKRVVAFMHDSMGERMTLGDLASLVGLSTFHFARQFRHSTGIAPHAYLVRVRVEEAARAILRGADPSDVAARVGFSSQGHLTQHMRKILGVTPGRLRRRRTD